MHYFMEDKSGWLAGRERHLLEAYICRSCSIRKQGIEHNTGPGPTTIAHFELYR
jgi:hypothetical protein